MALMAFGRDLDPVRALLDLQGELDRFLSRPPAWNLGLSGRGVFPPINVFRDTEGIVVRAEVPGVKREALGVQIEGRTLTLNGERMRGEEHKGSYHRRERRFGEFSRSVQLPEDVDGQQTVAEYKDGILTIRIPKRAEARTRQVPVKTV